MLIYAQKQEQGGGMSHSALATNGCMYFNALLPVTLQIFILMENIFTDFSKIRLHLWKFSQFFVKSESSSQSFDSDTNFRSVFRFQFGFEFLHLAH